MIYYTLILYESRWVGIVEDSPIALAPVTDNLVVEVDSRAAVRTTMVDIADLDAVDKLLRVSWL